MSFSEEVQDSYYEAMKKIYGDKFGCDCKHLSSSDLYNKELVNELIKWDDIIYEGGGDTLPMIQLWKETGFDKKLYEAWEEGKVIYGISAGAVCWFKYCNSDCDNSKFEIVDDKYKIITSGGNNRNFSKGYIYKAYWNNGKYFETKLSENKDFLPLKGLFEKEKNDK